ncbi:hypothetical protein KFK09_009184 [Dendrobium nobile]|uniref:Uncharacterized protein n=1 Tax=Dendrobium nobile TaxID=94219 RepID=A0A8T3BQ13_DENNO|nr:hypothetical protein KFK09_009184 [Dendrobium nobile]
MCIKKNLKSRYEWTLRIILKFTNKRSGFVKSEISNHFYIVISKMHVHMLHVNKILKNKKDIDIDTSS